VGLTVLDAGVVIGFLDANDAHHKAAYRELAEAQGRQDRIALPASALAECLVAPARRSPEDLAAAQEFVARMPIEVAELTREIAVAAATLRARHRTRLKLPDALVIATAQVLEADVLVTTDRDWPKRGTLGLRSRLVEL
jgi:predicted nucleic acid-binding protein